MESRNDIRQAIDAHRREIMDFLRAMVDCDSFTRDKEGVDEVGRLVLEAMPAAFSRETVPSKTTGDHHVCRRPGDGARPVVMAGHLDTICCPDESFAGLTAEGDKLIGPGVNDMKGGIAVIVWSLKVLEECGLLGDLPVTCIFNGDEEQGSPSSNRIFRDMGGKACVGLVYECGHPKGTVVTKRKGIQRHRLHIAGKAAHFGNLKGPKMSAVEEMAHKILAAEALNREDGSVAVNVGRAEGGLLANCVAEQASMDFELRYWDAALAAEASEQVVELCRAPVVPGCTLRCERLSGRPPMEPDAPLFALTAKVSAALGRPISEEARGGVSDACWLSHVGVPTVDGLGPLGDLDHTADEYIIAETLYERIELTVHLLLALRQAGFVS